MTYEEMKAAVFAEIQKYREEMTALSDRMADGPELSGREFNTSRGITELLKKHGYTTEYPFGGKQTAFRAVYGDNSRKHKAALLVEYDALPDLGHACGHCLSGAAGILAALALRPLQDVLDTDMHIIGTPDEEDDGAKCYMAADGVFDGYDLAIMTHMYDKNLVMPRFQALGEFFYEFRGQAAHASAAPWEGRNALNGVQLMMHAIDMLRQHTRPDAQFHGVIKDGGVFPNIVPERAELHLFIRAGDKRYMEELVRLTDDCARGAATATQTEWKRKPQEQTYYVDLRRNEAGEAALREVFTELGIKENAPADTLFGSSDIGNVSYACPAFHPCLQITDGVPIHTREFEQAVRTDRAHKAIATAARIMALHIAKVFGDKETLSAVRADFTKDQ